MIILHFLAMMEREGPFKFKGEEKEAFLREDGEDDKCWESPLSSRDLRSNHGSPLGAPRLQRAYSDVLKQSGSQAPRFYVFPNSRAPSLRRSFSVIEWHPVLSLGPCKTKKAFALHPFGDLVKRTLRRKVSQSWSRLKLDAFWQDEKI